MSRALARPDAASDGTGWSSGRPYPFDLYGVLVADQIFVYALETQTLSLHPALPLRPGDGALSQRSRPGPSSRAALTSGTAIASRREQWSDLWLNEGHATWYEKTYGAEFISATSGLRLRGVSSSDAYANGDQWRADFGPVAMPSQTDIRPLQPERLRGRSDGSVRAPTGDRRSHVPRTGAQVGTALRGRDP